MARQHMTATTLRVLATATEETHREKGVAMDVTIFGRR